MMMMKNKILTIILTVVFFFSFHFMLKAENMDIKQRTVLKDAMDQMFSIIEYIHKNPVLTEEEKKSKILNFIRVIRYGPEKKDTFFAITIEPYMLVDPYNVHLEGARLTDWKNDKGQYLFLEYIYMIRRYQESYYNHDWIKYDGKFPVPCVTFIRIFKPYQWIIGTRLYNNNIEAYEKVELFLPLRNEPIQPPYEPASPS